MERVVKRTELESDGSSSDSSPEPEAVERLKQLESFDIVTTSSTTVGNTNQDDQAMDADADEGGYDFRLFRSTKAAENEQPVGSVHKIRLRSPSISKDNIGFIKPERNSEYYFATSASKVEKQNFESTAMTGAQILANAQNPWPGSSYSWKVLHLPITNVAKSIRTQMLQPFQRLVDDDRTLKRTRPGKKYRIKLRRKLAAKLARQDAKDVAAAAKEAAEREKRARRNREKKIKKRMRDKSKKAAAATVTTSPDPSSSNESASPELPAD